MIGYLIEIKETEAKIKLLLDLKTFQSLLNLYVVFEEKNKEETKIVGEIISIKEDIAIINLIGEIIEDKFIPGIINKPSFSSNIKIISKEKISMIIGMDSYNPRTDLILGTSPIYKNVKIGVNINDFLSNHFAIFGSTGNGKSCSIARIIQNIFNKKEAIPFKASIMIFDAYGEYHSAFKEINKASSKINFKSYTTDLNAYESEIVQIPLWLLDTDDIALLLQATEVGQLTTIEQALKLVNVFAREEEEVLAHKNDIIARALLEILTSGKTAAQLRDQIFSVLSRYNTRQLNLDSQIIQTGYTRPLKQCLVIDHTGKIRDMEILTAFFENYLSMDLILDLPDKSFKYTLKDLEAAFDFALISEGLLKTDKIYDKANSLRVRLHALVNSKQALFFDYDNYITEEMYIRTLVTAHNNQKAQIVNFNISNVDDRMAKIITKIYSKMLFNFSKENQNINLPFHIILEEAHRYVQNDNDINILGYNIFDRITKEGRKYGVIMGFISQRPSELSETALSQCTNFLIFKMLHPRDFNYIKQMVPSATEGLVDKIKILRPGICMAFGGAFKTAPLIEFEMPNPAPTSSNKDISKIWYVE